MKKTYKSQSIPSLAQRIQWYNRKFWPWILVNISIAIVLAVAISFTASVGWSFLIGITLALVAYLNAPHNLLLSSCDHMIHEVTVDHERKEVEVKYCMLFNSKKVIPFEKLHANVAQFSRTKGITRQSHLFLFTKTMRSDYCVGSVKYPCEAYPWDKEELYHLSNELFHIRRNHKTWRHDEIIRTSPSGAPVIGKWSYVFNHPDEIG